MSAEAPAFGVYLHWPFCAAKCPYCDFNSHVRHVPPDQERYARAFAAEIAHMAARAPGRRVTSIFLGGGTPSLMAPSTVGAVLESVARHWTIADDAEITLEANPGSVEAERFRGYRAVGVNRVSLGVQALDDVSLKALGRIHTADEALKAIGIARDTFPRLSFDLIYARPGQTLDTWRAELIKALDFARRPHLGLSADHRGRHALRRTLCARKTDPARCRPRRRPLTTSPARNWRRAACPATRCRTTPAPAPRAGITCSTGAAATMPASAPARMAASGRTTAGTRWRPRSCPRTGWRASSPTGHGIIVDDVLDAEAIGQEFLLMGLRLAEGVDPRAYEARSGRALDAGKLAFLEGHGLIRRDGDRVAATEAGFKVLNALISELAG